MKLNFNDTQINRFGEMVMLFAQLPDDYVVFIPPYNEPLKLSGHLRARRMGLDCPD